MNPKITVVTVCYNAEKDIEKTILSVINQTYENVEYIIVDGASKDGTMDIVNKYRDKISVIVSEPDKGIYDAMNKGIKIATGDWINFMNAGDCFANIDVVEKIFSNQSFCKDIGFIYGETNLYKEGKYVGVFQNNPFWKSIMPFRTGKGFCHQSTFTRLSLVGCGFDLSFPIAADFEMAYRIIKNGYSPEYVPVFICNFDMVGKSCDQKNRIQCLDEDSKILGCENTIPFKIYRMLLKFRNK